MRYWTDWVWMVIGGLVVAVVVFLGLLGWQHYQTDDALLHEVILPVLQYNVQQGRLLPLPAPQAAPQAPAPAPAAKAPEPAPTPPAAKKAP